jgi:hypothetical protein
MMNVNLILKKNGEGVGLVSASYFILDFLALFDE